MLEAEINQNADKLIDELKNNHADLWEKYITGETINSEIEPELYTSIQRIGAKILFGQEIGFINKKAIDELVYIIFAIRCQTRNSLNLPWDK